jgi:cyclohexa-1,5-dienecarbonyl-CoA hydratase
MATQTQSGYQSITVRLDAPVARIVLSRPPLNVIDMAMMDELLAAIEQIEQQPEVTVIVFSGSPKAFSAGVEIAEHTPEKVEGMLRKFHSVIRSLLATKKVTIAAVEGACLGGGAELALVCDLVYTARDASWAFPEIKLGCYPPVACAALAALVGQKRAADLILTGRQISGDEAMAIGLATGAARGEEVTGQVNDAIGRLSQLSPSTLKIAKKAFYAWDAFHLDKGLNKSEQLYFDELMKTRDAVEGIEAFLGKRKPVWTGK